MPKKQDLLPEIRQCKVTCRLLLEVVLRGFCVAKRCALAVAMLTKASEPLVFVLIVDSEFKGGKSRSKFRFAIETSP